MAVDQSPERAACRALPALLPTCFAVFMSFCTVEAIPPKYVCVAVCRVFHLSETQSAAPCAFSETVLLMFSQALLASCLKPSHLLATSLLNCSTPLVTSFQTPPQNSPAPLRKSQTPCHFSEIQPVKSAHICLPVSVCVKNHVRPATAALTAAMPRPIGLAVIRPVRLFHPPPRPPNFPPSPSAFPPRSTKPPAMLLIAPPMGAALCMNLPTAVVTPPNASTPSPRFLTSSCCSGDSDLNQSEAA